MRWSYERSPGWVFVTRMIGFISFLIFIVFANILTSVYIQSAFLLKTVSFLDNHLPLLLLIAVMVIIADVLSAFPFPLDLPAPIIQAFASVFIIIFLLDMVQQLGGNSSNTFQVISFLIVPLLFLIVIISGYYRILKRLFLSDRLNRNVAAVADPMIGTPAPEGQTNEAKTWEDVHSEFRMMLWDLFHRIREELAGKR